MVRAGAAGAGQGMAPCLSAKQIGVKIRPFDFFQTSQKPEILTPLIIVSKKA
jgi:hypothetical protein